MCKLLKLWSIGLMMSFLSLGISSAQDIQDPVEYLEAINTPHKSIDESLWAYMKVAAHSKNARKVEKKRQELLNNTELARQEIAKLPAYEENTEYRDAVLTFLSLSYKVLNEDYAEIVNLEEIAEQSYDLMEAYLSAKEQANDKVDEAFKVLSEELKKFATAFNIQLIEGEDDKTSLNISKAGEVLEYHNDIYLIFFKSFKQEAYLIDAQNNRDVNAMEQNKSALISFSQEGLKKLNDIPSLNQDGSLKVACRDLLKFYLDEGQNKASFITDFYLKGEKLQRAQTALESKKASKRSKEEVDRFNKLVNDYNGDLKKFNQLNEDLNKRRNTLLNNWNEVASKFMDKHVPK